MTNNDIIYTLEEILKECDKLKQEPCSCHHYKRGIRFCEDVIYNKIKELNAQKKNLMQ